MSIEKIEEGAYLFAYFRSGPDRIELQPYMHFAVSEDGYHWAALNNNEPVFRSTHGRGIIRDPFIERCKDGKWRLVYTGGIDRFSLGYSESADLITWKPSESRTLMGDHEDCMNVWAPEFIYDEKNGDYVVHWSSSLNKRNDNNRIMYSRTKDFVSFRAARVLYAPGYPIIDSHIVEKDGRFFLFFKDERKFYQADKTFPSATRYAVAPSPGGPYTAEGGNVVTPDMTEGPEVFRLYNGDTYLLYTDYWPYGTWALCESENLQNWRLVSDRRYTMPYQARHGGFFKISKAELRALTAHYGVQQIAPGRTAGAKSSVSGVRVWEETFDAMPIGTGLGIPEFTSRGLDYYANLPAGALAQENCAVFSIEKPAESKPLRMSKPENVPLSWESVYTLAKKFDPPLRGKYAFEIRISFDNIPPRNGNFEMTGPKSAERWIFIREKAASDNSSPEKSGIGLFFGGTPDDPVLKSEGAQKPFAVKKWYGVCITLDTGAGEYGIKVNGETLQPVTKFGMKEIGQFGIYLQSAGSGTVVDDLVVTKLAD